ncbi:hypothetical protein OBA47_00915 [bacterium]|nr:hypothetical protein [bacterium]
MWLKKNGDGRGFEDSSHSEQHQQGDGSVAPPADAARVTRSWCGTGRHPWGDAAPEPDRNNRTCSDNERGIDL